MDVAIVGAGRVGTAMAVRLSRAGHRIVAVSGGDRTRERAARFLPDVPVLEPTAAVRGAHVVLIATPDDHIRDAAAAVAPSLAPASFVAHVSGATALAALAPAAAVGARIASIHPLQTFPDVASAIDRLEGCAMAVTANAEEARAVAERIARDAGGRPFELDDAAKPLYHAAAVFASNYLVAATALAERVGLAAGLEDPVTLLAPLQAATLDNVRIAGPGPALTGPAVRGDVGTIAGHLDALAERVPDAIPAYVALARAALDVAVTSGRLSEERRAAVEDVLGRWS
jgi:predicted short-subunit dehydrogenase-like oxidoreductase (DUF2520 family)